MSVPQIMELARAVEESWRRTEWDEGAFPDIAGEALSGQVELSFAQVVEQLFSGEELPPQRRLDLGFGQPALTVFHGEHFDLEILCWHDDVAAIHEHSFSGAFKLLEGNCLQPKYQYDHDRDVSQVQLGRLERISAEVLEPGAVVTIHPGPAMIHSTFHLHDVGMTLVARTRGGAIPERTFLPPGVAYDSGQRSPELRKLLQMLDTLNAVSFNGYADKVHEVIARGDAYETLAVLLRAGSHIAANEAFDGFVEHVHKRFDEAGDLLTSAVVEERRRGMLARLRRSVRDPETRFAIACLMICSDRDDFRGLFALRSPRNAGSDLAASLLAPLLDGDPDRQTVAHVAIAGMLNDNGTSEFMAAIAEISDEPLNDRDQLVLERYLAQLREVPWLAPLQSARGDA